MCTCWIPDRYSWDSIIRDPWVLCHCFDLRRELAAEYLLSPAHPLLEEVYNSGIDDPSGKDGHSLKEILWLRK